MACVAITKQNNLACKLFNKAADALLEQDFDTARRYIDGYRANVSYPDFFQQDKRGFHGKGFSPLAQEIQNPTAPPDISVVIVAYNTGAELISCIQSIFSGTNNNFELIVVDNGGNGSILPDLLDLPILYIATPMNLGPSEGRNIGVSYARAPLCAFVDDDAIAAPDFVEKALAIFNDFPASDEQSAQFVQACQPNKRQPSPQYFHPIQAVRGKVLPKTQSAFQNSAPHYELGDEVLPRLIDAEGNSVWRKESYLEAGGMDPVLFGREGSELAMRLARKFGQIVTFYMPDLVIYHDFAHSQEKEETKKERCKLMSKYTNWKLKHLEK